MADNWNKAGFFSGITEDYSNYHWYKGEKENPYKSDTFHPLAASFWEYEKEFHYSYLDACDTKKRKALHLPLTCFKRFFPVGCISFWIRAFTW